MPISCSGPQTVKAAHGVQTARAICDTLAGYFKQAHGAQRVSVADAMAHIRSVFPMLKCSEGRLIDIIAGAVIVADLDIVWDCGREHALYERWSDKADF